MPARDQIDPSPDAALSFAYCVDEPWAIVTVSGELDLASAAELRAALEPPALPAGRTCVALDLSGLSFCDSSGIGAFVGVYKKLQARGGQLILLHVPDQLARRLQIIGLDRLIPLRRSVRDA